MYQMIPPFLKQRCISSFEGSKHCNFRAMTKITLWDQPGLISLIYASHWQRGYSRGWSVIFLEKLTGSVINWHKIRRTSSILRNSWLNKEIISLSWMEGKTNELNFQSYFSHSFEQKSCFWVVCVYIKNFCTVNNI